MNLYNTIFTRRSVRQFTDKLSDKILKDLEAYIKNGVKPLIANINYIIKIADAQEVKTQKVNAPNYILFYSEDREGYKLNAGYIMQQIDLFLQSVGAGSCWIGMAAPIDKKLNGYEYVIMLGVGMTEKPYRESIDNYKRKELIEIGNINREVLNAIRLAPSAVNCQPWYYEQVTDNTIQVRLVRKVLHKLILSYYDYIDIGISICYCDLAYQEQGKRVVLLPTESANRNTFLLRIEDIN